MPGRSSAPSTARAAKPTPPAAPAPGCVARSSRPVAAATRSAQWASAASSCGDLRPASRPSAARRPRPRRAAPSSGLSTSLATMTSAPAQPAAQAGQVEPVEVGERGAAAGELGRRARRAAGRRAPATMPAPPSVLALPPMPSTTCGSRRRGRPRSPRRCRGWSRSAASSRPPGSRPSPDDVGQLDDGRSRRDARTPVVDRLAGRPGGRDRDRARSRRRPRRPPCRRRRRRPARSTTSTSGRPGRMPAATRGGDLGGGQRALELVGGDEDGGHDGGCSLSRAARWRSGRPRRARPAPRTR